MELLAAAAPAVLGVVLQLGALAWYGGRMAARLDHLERRLDRLERQLDKLFSPRSAAASA